MHGRKSPRLVFFCKIARAILKIEFSLLRFLNTIDILLFFSVYELLCEKIALKNESLSRMWPQTTECNAMQWQFLSLTLYFSKKREKSNSRCLTLKAKTGRSSKI